MKAWALRENLPHPLAQLRGVAAVFGVLGSSKPGPPSLPPSPHAVRPTLLHYGLLLSNRIFDQRTSK